jgi:hypothetical protein
MKTIKRILSGICAVIAIILLVWASARFFGYPELHQIMLKAMKTSALQYLGCIVFFILAFVIIKDEK